MSMTVKQINARVDQFCDSIETRLRELRRDHPRAQFRYRISPRWGCGSPAEFGSLLLSAVLDEVRNYCYALEGAYGPEQQREAESDRARSGIAVVFWDARCHWECHDLLTGESFRQPYSGRKRCKHTRHPDGWINKAVHDIGSSYDLELPREERAKLMQVLERLRDELTGKGPVELTRIGQPAFTYDDQVIW